jgi:tetratricopeptide (TPR) repeat protein
MGPVGLPSMLEVLSIKEILQRKAFESALRADSKFASLDRERYRSRLNKIWKYNHTSTAKGFVTSLITDIATISVTLDQISGEDEITAKDILCHYLLIYGHIMRDQQQYAEAIIALEEAVKIAECVNNNQLLAVALLRLANVYYNRGDIALAQSKVDTARGDSTGANAKRASANADFQVAAGQFARVHSMKNIAPEINIALLMGESNIRACLAHGQNDAILESLALLRQAENIIANNYLRNSEGYEYSLFAGSIDIAKRRLQISKASALFTACTRFVTPNLAKM